MKTVPFNQKEDKIDLTNKTKQLCLDNTKK